MRLYKLKRYIWAAGSVHKISHAFLQSTLSSAMTDNGDGNNDDVKICKCMFRTFSSRRSCVSNLGFVI